MNPFDRKFGNRKKWKEKRWNRKLGTKKNWNLKIGNKEIWEHGKNGTRKKEYENVRKWSVGS